MQRYCEHCGHQLEEGARVCGNCGTPIYGGVQTPEVEDQRGKKVGAIIKIAVIAAAVLIVALIAVRVVVANTGTNKLIKKTMAAYKDYDIDALVDLSSDVYLEGDWASDYFTYTVGDDLDKFENRVGYNYKIKYKVEDKYTLSDRGTDKIIRSIEDGYPDFDIDSIKKIAVAEIEVTAKQGRKSVTETVKLTMTKENGKWKLLYME